MLVSLRKAHKIVTELQKHLNVRGINKSIHHSSFEDEAKKVVQSVYLQNKEYAEKAIQVADTVSSIRRAVQLMNNTQVDADGNTIDFMLTEKVLVESKMKLLSSFSAPARFTDEERLADILREVKDNHESTSEYRSLVTQVSGVSEEVHNEFNTMYRTLKQQQEEIIDKLAYMNNNFKIELSDAEVTLLKELQII